MVRKDLELKYVHCDSVRTYMVHSWS